VPQADFHFVRVSWAPLCVFAHGTVGLQHATMAMYNAWCDRVPVYVVVGNVRDVQMRRPGIEWNHTAQDVGIICRDAER
jgi:acetolactate synthase I/II/III large subunit